MPNHRCVKNKREEKLLNLKTSHKNSVLSTRSENIQNVSFYPLKQKADLSMCIKILGEWCKLSQYCLYWAAESALSTLKSLLQICFVEVEWGNGPPTITCGSNWSTLPLTNHLSIPIAPSVYPCLHPSVCTLTHPALQTHDNKVCLKLCSVLHPSPMRSPW